MPSWLSNLSSPLLIAYIAGLLIAIALIVVVIYRVAFGHRLRVPHASRTRQPRLGLVDAFSLDGQRQLVLVRRDNIEHLVMIGGPNDVVVESQIIRAAVSPAARERDAAAVKALPIAPAVAIEAQAASAEPAPQPPRVAPRFEPPPVKPVERVAPAPLRPPIRPAAPPNGDARFDVAPIRPAAPAPTPARPGYVKPSPLPPPIVAPTVRARTTPVVAPAPGVPAGKPPPPAPAVKPARDEAFADLDATGVCLSFGEYQRDAYGIALPLRVGREGTLMALNCGAIELTPDVCALRERIVPAIRQAAVELTALLEDVNSEP